MGDGDFGAPVYSTSLQPGRCACPPEAERSGTLAALLAAILADALPRSWQWLIAGVEGLRKAPQARRGARHAASWLHRPIALADGGSQANFAQGRAAKLIVPAAPKDWHTGEAMRLGVSELGLRLGPVEVHKYAG